MVITRVNNMYLFGTACKQQERRIQDQAICLSGMQALDF